MFVSKYPYFRVCFINVCILLLAFSNRLTAQSKPETFTNQTVVALVKAGLDNSTIISTINNASHKFDLSSQGLINLKKQGVSNEIIAAMVEKLKEGSSAVAHTQSAAASANKKTAKYKTELINHPYALTVGAGTVIALQKSIANIGTHTKGLGYGGVTSQYEVAGLNATVRKSVSDSLVFIVNTAGSAPEFVLYKAKVAKDKRTAATFSAGPFQKAKSANNTISFNIVPESNGVFRLTTSEKLAKGEYFFAGKNIGSSTAIDVYAFGID